MDNKVYADLLNILQKEVVLATGCTEPIAVAYSAAVAANELGEHKSIKTIDVWVDSGIYKNGLRVGIPGIKERGLDIAAALGAIVCQPEKKLNILESITDEQIQKAKDMVQNSQVHVHVKGNCNRLYVETILNTAKDAVRVLTLDRHQNVAKIEKGNEFGKIDIESDVLEATVKPLQKFELDDILDFVYHIDIQELSFLNNGVSTNFNIALEGLEIQKGIGKELSEMMVEGWIENNMVSRAQILCSAASEARMAGSTLPVMSCAGSGNHGITTFLTVLAVAEKLESSNEKLLRALALTNLITVYIKSYTGTLSAMCGCGVAAGIGASAGVVYLLDGSKDAMFGAMLNMVGSISGLICDGGKEGCAYKLALSSGWAVQSALLAVRGAVVNENNGILSANFQQLFENLGYICNPGMVETNRKILEVMQSTNEINI